MSRLPTPVRTVAGVVVALAAIGCQAATDGAGAPAPAPQRTPRVAQRVIDSPRPMPSTPGNAYALNGPAPGSGAGLRVGYLSMAEWNPYIRLVTTSIQEQASIAGVELTFCDADYDDATALACARQFGAAGVQGVLNFQANQALAPALCTAYGGVPTIAIDILQPPCQVAFMGADNRTAGRLGGEAMGRFVKDRWDCAYSAYVSLESMVASTASDERMSGYREGFRTFCPILEPLQLKPADNVEQAADAVSEMLGRMSGDRIVVVGINENAILGAIQAATASGREADLYYSGQGADPVMWREIACDPHYVASVAYFPEHYGRILVPAIIDIIRGATTDGATALPEVPASLFTRHEVVTAANIRQIYPATPPC